MKSLHMVKFLLIAFLPLCSYAQDTVWLSGRVQPFTAQPNTIYATRNSATVSRFVDLVFNQISPGLWESQLVSRPELLVGGTEAPLAPARLPNTGYFYFNSNSPSNTINFSLPSQLVGAEVFVWKNTTIVDRGIISSQSATQFTYSFISPDVHELPLGGGFFIQNHPAAMDLPGEWCYIGGRVRMLSPTRPVGIRASQPGALVTGPPSARLVAITLEGTNDIAARGVSLIGCTIRYAGMGAVVNDVAGARVQGCIFRYIANTAVWSSGSTNLTVIGNDIAEVGLEGYGSDYGLTNLGYHGVFLQFATGARLEGNTIRGVGYSGIHFVFSTNTLIRNNLVSEYCRVKSDGGAIYSWQGDEPGNYPGNVIDGNIVLNGQNNSEATRTPDYCPTYGIYLDDNADGVAITNNTVAGAPRAGMYIHNCDNLTITGNRLYNNGWKGNPVAWSQIEWLGERTDPDSRIRNIVFRGNELVARTRQQLCVKWDSRPGDFQNTTIAMDSNVYARPLDDGLTFRTYEIGIWEAQLRSLAGWRSYSGKDASSRQSPRLVTSVDSIRFHYALKDSSVSLPGTWIDMIAQRRTLIRLAPYTSAALLFFSGASTLPLQNPYIPTPRVSSNESFTRHGNFLKIKKRGVLNVYALDGRLLLSREVRPGQLVEIPNQFFFAKLFY